MLKNLLQLPGLKVYVGVAVAAAFLVSGGYYAWKRSVQQDAMAAWTVAQLRQIAAEQQRFAQQQREMLETAREIRLKIAEQQRETELKLGEIEKYLESPEVAKADKGSSIILRETIRRLGAGK